MPRHGPLEFLIMSAASGYDSNVANELINAKTVLLDHDAIKIIRVAL